VITDDDDQFPLLRQADYSALDRLHAKDASITDFVHGEGQQARNLPKRVRLSQARSDRIDKEPVGQRAQERKHACADGK